MIKKFFKYHPVHKKIVTYLDRIFIIQPTYFFIFWIFPILGMIKANNTTMLWNNNISLFTILIFLGITNYLVYIFIAYEKIFVYENYTKKDKNKFLLKILFILAFILTAISNYIVCIILTISILIIQYVMSLLENDDSDKNILYFILINCLIGLVLFIAGCIVILEFDICRNISNITLRTMPYVFYFLSILCLIIIQKNKDYLINLNNLFTYEYKLLFVSVILIFFSLYFSIKNGDPLGSISSIVSLPFFLFAFFRKLEKDFIRAINYPIFLINVFSFIYYPWLFIPNIIVYYITKYYYWHRFSLIYPKLIIND